MSGKPRKKQRGHKKGCGTKVAYETIELARDAAYRGRRHSVLHAYKCGKCKKFHYGHVKAGVSLSKY